MENQIEKLIAYSGGEGRYQILLLVIFFFIWQSVSIHNTSIAMLETVPLVKVSGKEKTIKLDYEICKDNYTVIEKYDYSWIIEMGIECDQAKVGLIGTSVNLGMTLGSFSFSIITKFLTYKDLIRIFLFFYVFFAFLTTIINNYYFKLVCLFFLGIGNCMNTMSTMNLISECVSFKKRSLFQGIVNVGYAFCPIMYTPLYILFGNWRFCFWIQNIIGIICGIMFLIFGKNSARMYFSKNKIEEGMNVLTQIAQFNGKLEEFKEKVNDQEFDDLLRNDKKKEIEKDLSLEKKFGYKSLLKYKSVKYKFLIFSFIFINTTFLTKAVVISAKSMEGKTYIIIVSLFCVEAIANICCGIIVNIPSFGRKKSLIGFYIGISIGFILTIVFPDSAIGCWLYMALIRFCITGVYTTLVVYLVESYPTPLRALGYGLNFTFGNLAGIISPLILEFINKYILYLFFAIIAGTNIFFILFLPKTLGKPMNETIEELEEYDSEKEKSSLIREFGTNNLDILTNSENKNLLLKFEDKEEKEDEEE